MKTLAEREIEFVKDMGPSDLAKRVAPKLGEIAEDLAVEALTLTPAGTEIRDLFVVHINHARELLRVLEQEQWRQREAIKLFLSGHVDRDTLRNISSTWNGDPK